MDKMNLFVVNLLIVVFIMLTGTVSGQNAYTKLCLQAVSFEEAGEFEKAVASYGEAINLKPDEWTGYNYRARVNYYTGKYDDAIADVTKAISLSPQTLSLYALRANCFEAKGVYDRALDDYSMALSKSGNNDKDAYLTYFKRGRTYLSVKKYQESLNDLTTALQIAQKYNKSIPEIYFYRAQSNCELKKYNEALSDLDAHLSAKPDDIRAIWLKGYSLLKTGEKEKAKAIAGQILQLDPTKEAYFSGNNSLDIFNSDMRREKSMKLIKEAKELISEHYSTPSRTLAGMKLTDAFRDLDTAWLFLPGLTKDDLVLRDTIKNNFFKVYPLMKTKPEISEQVRRYAVQASNATEEKRYDDAISLWTTTMKIAPYYPLAYFNRALLYETKGNLKLSISDIENYLKLTPDAADARSARDMIYAWEGKIKETGAAASLFQAGKINQIESKSYSPGNFKFAMAVGGTFGLQISKNPDLEELWAQCTQGATPDHAYSDKMPFLFSGDLELTVRPIKRLGIGAFGKYAGGIGTRTSVSDVKYIMDMGTLMYGGFIRGYLLVNNGAARPDVYVQYGLGQSQLTGCYGIATMDGIIFDYSYFKRFTGSDILHSAGVGIGGKIGRHGYLTVSADYLLSEIKKINYEVTIDKNNPGNVGSEGVVINTLSDSNTTAKYNGVVLKMLFGVCF